MLNVQQINFLDNSELELGYHSITIAKNSILQENVAREILMLYAINSIRQLEQAAINQFAIKEARLMTTAGQQAFKVLATTWPHLTSILVLCGKGNNGGDGYVLATEAKKAGIEVAVRYVGDIADLSAVASDAHADCQRHGVDIKPFDANETMTAEVLVDALLGIGVKGEVRGDYRLAIEWINRQSAKVLALDVPSGIDVDHGVVLGCAVKADVTVTFIGRKIGLYTGAAVDYTGRVVLADLQLPHELMASVKPDCVEIKPSELVGALRPRSRAAHKGSFGHVLIVGGNLGMVGAARMAAEAALRVGAGLVSVATRADSVTAISAGLPEAMSHGVANVTELAPLVERATTLVIGPGLGKDAWAQALVDYLLTINKPKVIDADALNLLSQAPNTSDQWVLTPHPGEAARLLNLPIDMVQADRLAVVSQLQARYQGVAVLKGVGSLVKADTIPAICLHGNPGMATGGMGDVLSGVIGGLLAQGLPLAQAAQFGVLIHAMAADESARVYGERGMRATDLMPEIRRFVNP